MKSFGILFCLVSAVVLSTVSARANVYATDIKLNGSLYTITNVGSTPVTISYRLNQPATLGVTVAIWQGSNQVATINGGTNMGLNSVVWGGTNNSGTNVTSGTYSVSIMAAASDLSGGTGNWTQISIDTNAGNYAFDPNGLAVDNNANSPYYGRVVVGCSFANGTAKNPISKQVIEDGIYKMNADSSFADEGGFGYGGYTRDDSGYTANGEMPPGSQFVPWRLRIGDDDRIYMLDFSVEGAIIAFDMEVTTNQVVIDDGGKVGGGLGGPHNYGQNPDLGDLQFGIDNFDISSTTTTNAAVWLCDGDVNGNWGIWMYHLVNGQSDTNDIGTQAVTTGGDLSQGSTGGCMVDNHLNIFCGQSETSTSAVYDAMVFTNWNHGVLPGISGGFSFTDGTSPGQVEWGFGCGIDTVCATNPTFEAVQDVVINSRTSPTMVACPMTAGNQSTNGIRLLNATDGAIVQSNIDFGQEYTCAAWDNVGNLYGASPSRKVWRVWSPPGASTNTTVAVAQLIVTIPFAITSITAVPTGAGCANVTIHFTAVGSPPSTAFTLVSSPALNGTFSPVSGAVITGSSGSYQATFSNCTTSFYEIEQSN
jgi:FlgD Ig-like domain